MFPFKSVFDPSENISLSDTVCGIFFVIDLSLFAQDFI